MDNQVQIQEDGKSNDDNNIPTIDTIEPRKPAIRILEHEIQEGLSEIQRPTTGLLMAGLSAGLDLGFSVLLMAVIITNFQGLLPRQVIELFTAYAYSIGFIFVVIGRSELFTEHTSLAILPVINGRANLTQLVRLWGLIYFSNLVGGAIFAGLIVLIGPGLGVVKPFALGDIASRAVNHPWWVIVISGILAGWLMGLLTWLVAAGRDTISQILIILLVTSTIGLLNLHHSIAGAIEVMSGLFAGQGTGWSGFGHFLLWTTLGNSIGGVVFFALIKYGHAIRGPNRPVDIHLED